MNDRLGRKADWDINLAEGQQAELWVLDILTSLKQGKDEIEVKRDFRTTDTGRLYIEVAQCTVAKGWVPSGLSITKAKIWFFVFGWYPGGLFVETEWLRRAVARASKHPSNWQEIGPPVYDRPTRAILVSFPHLLQTKDDYDPGEDAWRSVAEAYAAIRERMLQGGPGWKPK